MRRLRPSGESDLRTILAAASHGSEELRFLHRLHAVLLVSAGRNCYEVAQWFGENPRSIERWVHAYETVGEDGLHAHHRGGGNTRLTVQQLGELALDLGSLPSACGYTQDRWSGKLLARHIQNRFGVQLSLRHCQRLLHAVRH